MAQNGLAGVRPALIALAAAHAYTLVDAELVREGGSRYLRIYIDKPGGITLDDCEIYHRACVDIVESVDYDFLEVCSPGLDRPLKTQQDFNTHVGDRVEVRLYRPVGGSKQWEGVLLGHAEDKLTIEAAGETMTFTMNDVSLCRLSVEITEEMLSQAALDDDDVQE